ncbi:MAG: endo-1,4-beta-xylanase [Planctomycetota bacterium]
MLSFLVFDNNRPAAGRPLRHAYLVGPEGVPVAGEIHDEDGLIHCVKTTTEAAGLATQVDLDQPTLDEFMPADEAAELGLVPLGSLTLQTCLLPERNAPYLLSLELARHRIMLFLNKLEQWQLAHLAPTDPVMRLFELARLAFTDALVAQRHEAPPECRGFSPDAHKLALRALWLAVEASERLAARHAQQQFTQRADGSLYRSLAEAAGHQPPAKGAPPPIMNQQSFGVVVPQPPAIGVAVSPGAFGDPAKQALKAGADFIVTPMRWTDMEPAEGSYSYQGTDRWIEWAVRDARLPVVAGPIIDFSPGSLPEWMFIWENDYDTLRELVYEHVRAIVTRYRRTVARWTICSGLHLNTALRINFEQMMDLTRIAAVVVRKLHPAAKIQVEIAEPWGESYTANRRSLPPSLYAEMIAQAGVAIDTLGVRVHMGEARTGGSTRDLMAFSTMLDHYAGLDRPVALTAVGAPARPPASSPADTPAGWWRSPWSDAAQAHWLEAYLGLALSKPYVQSVCWQGVTDAVTPGAAAGLINDNGTARPALERLAALRKCVTSRTPARALALLAEGPTAGPADRHSGGRSDGQRGGAIGATA